MIILIYAKTAGYIDRYRYIKKFIIFNYLILAKPQHKNEILSKKINRNLEHKTDPICTLGVLDISFKSYSNKSQTRILKFYIVFFLHYLEFFHFYVRINPPNIRPSPSVNFRYASVRRKYLSVLLCLVSGKPEVSFLSLMSPVGVMSFDET